MEPLISSVPDELREMIAAALGTGLAKSCDALIRHFSNLPLFSRHLEQLMRPDLTACAKDANAAAISKRRGNVAFGERDYNGALSLYTKALRDAPASSGKTARQSIATILVNRAATLHKLGHFERSVEDCDRALVFSAEYSKAWYRRGRVKYDLRDFEGAFADMERAFAYEPSAGGQSEIKMELTRMELEKRAALDTGCEQSCSPSPGSRALDVQLAKTGGLQHSKLCWTEEKGWSLAAQEELAVGTLVLHESPYAAVILKRARDTHCHFCFELLPINPVACNGCAIPLYCTDACKARASGIETEDNYCVSSHERERDLGCASSEANPRTDGCGSINCELKLRENQGGVSTRIGEHTLECGGACWSAVLPSDAILAARMLRCTWCFDTDLDKSSMDPVKGAGVLPQIASLSHHYARLSPDEKLELHVVATVVAYCMRQPAALKPTVTAIACKLVVLIAQVRINSMAISGMPSSPGISAHKSGNGVDFDVVNTTHVSVASGIFVIGSRVNHSCVPNVHASFVSGRLFVRAITNISKDSALELCYGPEVGQFNQHERKNQLQKKYFFNCTCTACSSLILPDLLLQSFRCSKSGCMGIVLGAPLNSIFSTACSISAAYPSVEEGRKNANSASSRTGTEGVPHLPQCAPEAIDGNVRNSRFAKQSLLQTDCKAGLCLCCGTEVDTRAAREISLTASSHIERVQALITETESINNSLCPEELVEGVMKALSSLRGAVHSFSKQLAKGEDVAARLLFIAGHRLRALKHCQKSIEILEHLYGKQHIVVVHEHIKLASIALLVPLVDCARGSLAIVDRVFTAHYGSGYRRKYSFIETLEQLALGLPQ